MVADLSLTELHTIIDSDRIMVSSLGNSFLLQQGF
jgi:hypothetical protein